MDDEIDEALCAKIDHLNQQVRRELNDHLFGDEWAVKKRRFRWLKFWNWRLKLKGGES